MAKKRFRAVLEPHETTQALIVTIPFDVKEAFGTRARVPVRARIRGHEFRSSIFPMGGRHMLVLNREVREAAKAQANETVTVEIERDTEPRVVTPPEDLARALAASPAAAAAWEKLSYTHRKEHAKAVEDAKRPETRERRIRKTIETLSAAK